MKIKIYNFIIFIAILCFSYSNAKKLKEVHNIISAKLNGTATYVSLETVDQNEKYIYFTFDFKFHHSAVKTDKNIAKFVISSDFELKVRNKEDMKYGFVEKIWNKIKTDDDIKNIKWEVVEIEEEEKPANDINYYFKIKRKNKKMKTLLLRIPVNGRSEGSVSVENLLEFPFDKIDWDKIEGL